MPRVLGIKLGPHPAERGAFASNRGTKLNICDKSFTKQVIKFVNDFKNYPEMKYHARSFT